ncbi:hypothetical protein [Glaciecola punicea]|uniref:hypothetical protein n=1 Tax=Glaciecola punicea TaxID=56804 RepID=UPI001496012A|nr:hypothetical protein [Glaciecola punicea]
MEDNNNPFEIGIFELIAKANDEEETLFVGRASLRCSALQSLIFNFFSKASPQKDWSNLQTSASALLNVGIQINQQKLTERGIKNDIYKQAKEQAFNEFKSYTELYTQWLSANAIQQGEYLGSSPSATSELEQCKALSNTVING